MEVIDEKGNIIPDKNLESKRVLSGVLAIIFGPLGIHKFVLGYTLQGVLMLGFTLITFGVGAGLTGVIGLIEGIIYLTKSDEEFIECYQINKKTWF